MGTPLASAPVARAKPKARRPVRIGPGCQAVVLPSGWWHLRWYDATRTPKQKQHALDTDDESLALTRARDRWERRMAGLYDPWQGAGRALTVEQACEAYKTEHADRFRTGSVRIALASARHLARTTGRTYDPDVAGSGADPAALALREVTTAHVRRYVYRDGLSLVSRLSYWRRLKAFFGWAVSAGHLDASPVKDVPRPESTRAGLKHLSRAEVARLLAAVEAYHGEEGPIPRHLRRRDAYPLWARDAFELYAATGLRRGEGIALRWRDVVFPEASPWGVGFVHVVDEGRTGGRRTKTGRSRQVTMVPAAEALLRRLASETRRTSDENEHILKGADGIREVSPDTLSHNFRRYRKWAGLPVVSLHGLRHSFAVDLLLRGANLIQVRDELGHATTATTERYLTLLPAERARSTSALFAAEPALQRPPKRSATPYEPVPKSEDARIA